MSVFNNAPSIDQFPSMFSSSHISSEAEPFQEISIKYIMEDKLAIVVDNQDVSPIEAHKVSLKRQFSQELLMLQLKRQTSFEQILVQNHRNMILLSLKEYLQSIDHKVVDKLRYCSNEGSRMQNLRMKEQRLQEIIKDSKLQRNQQAEIITRFKHNLDQINIIHDVIALCPQSIVPSITFFIYSLLQSCDSLIQNFTKKAISNDLKNKSIETKKALFHHPILQNLFQSEQKERLQECFELLVQKCLISLFLMKVGVFENELETKTIDQCLRSPVFKEIRLNDLLNQHLLKPQKKVKRQ